MQAIEIEIAAAKDSLATKQDILLLRHELAELRHDVGDQLSRGEFRAAMVSSTRHMYGAIMGAIMGQFALLLGVAYFFVTHVRP